MPQHSLNPEFDAYAQDYDAALNQGLAVSGEDKNYFARGRLQRIAWCLGRLGYHPATILDFGCGTGSATPFFLEYWPRLVRLLGTDISPTSLDVAQRRHGCERIRFQLMDQHHPDAGFDLAFCNGVFHHIPLAERPGAAQYIHDSLRPGGFFAFWENNPWNPGARLVMSRIPFDRDAVMLWPGQARRLLRAAGFEVLRTDFLFVFPRLLKWLRPTERLLTRLPAGAQYLVLCRRRAQESSPRPNLIQQP